MVEDRLAAAIMQRFISRTDVKAVQQGDGTYRPDRSPWTVSEISRHLAGEATFGHYLLGEDNSCKLFALDIDLDTKGEFANGEPFSPRDVWLAGPSPARTLLQRQLRGLAEGLAWRAKRICKVPTAVAYSGSKGLHVYGFMGVTTAELAREAAVAAVDYADNYAVLGHNFWKSPAFPFLTVELFPKQDKVREGDGLGNLMRLPLGIHRKTGKSGVFIRATAEFPKFVADDPEQALELGTTR